MSENMLGLSPGAFAKLDAEEDEIFYEPARLVCHIDDDSRHLLAKSRAQFILGGLSIFDSVVKRSCR